MKANDLVKLHTMKNEELKSKLEALQKELVEARMMGKLAREKNLHKNVSLRRDIARVKTIMREKELRGEVEKPKVGSEKSEESTRKTKSKTSTVSKAGKLKGKNVGKKITEKGK